MENMKKASKDRTFEELLYDLRTQRQWKYVDVSLELYKLGIVVDEKTIKKWEVGLSYPDLNTIYKLSELFFVSSQDFLNAKEISLKKSYNSIHMTIIKWFCYFTGFTLKFGYYFAYIFFGFMFFVALAFFAAQVSDLKNLNW